MPDRPNAPLDIITRKNLCLAAHHKTNEERKTKGKKLRVRQIIRFFNVSHFRVEKQTLAGTTTTTHEKIALNEIKYQLA